MFTKEINPFPVFDRIRFRNIDKTLTLSVKGAASPMIIALKMAQERLSALTDDSTDEDRLDAAKAFAKAIFGDSQAEQLLEFYNNDALTVISVCGQYFSNRLGKKITKAQER